MSKKSIGFIGLGAMGIHMSKHLLKAGYPLTVFDLNPAPVAELAGLGAKTAKTSAEAAQDKDVIITMLPADPEVKAAVLGPEGVLATARAGATLVDMTSLSPHTAKLVAAEAEKKGLRFIDAPVSGGTVGAEKASLTIMVGGEAQVLEGVREILLTMGKTIFHVGPVGMGETVKMINQILVGINLVGICEAFVLGTKLGADPKVLYEVIRTSAGASFMMENRVPTYILKGNFTQPGFFLDLLKKDVGLAVDSGKIEKVPLFLTSQVFQLLTMASASGMGRKDQSSVIEILENAVGVEVRAKD